ncbi:MAG: hypothetical protein SPiBPW_24130 [Shewanella algae]
MTINNKYRHVISNALSQPQKLKPKLIYEKELKTKSLFKNTNQQNLTPNSHWSNCLVKMTIMYNFDSEAIN